MEINEDLTNNKYPILTQQQLESIPIPQGYKCGCYHELHLHKDEEGIVTNYPMFFQSVEEMRQHSRITHGAIKNV